MTYAFTSEKGAEDFVSFMASQFGVETEVLSYLHVEIDEQELGGIDPEGAERIHEKAQECGAENVLL